MQTIQFLLFIIDAILYRPLTWPYNTLMKKIHARWRKKMKSGDPCFYIENGNYLPCQVERPDILNKGEAKTKIKIVQGNKTNTLVVFTKDLIPRKDN